MATPRILGLPFRTGVRQQIATRQIKLANVNRWGNISSGAREGQPDELVVFESATSFVRLSSAVSVDGPDRLKLLENNLEIGQGNISGYNLAKNLVLWGGVNIQNNPSILGAQTSDYYGLNSSYGFLSDGGQGLKPMPGITSMTTSYKNNGSLREATLQIKCFTRKQFEAIEAVYLRLGYTMVLEWGHTDYFNNDGTRGSLTTYSILNKLFNQPSTSADEILKQIEKNKANTSYNYDGLLARVTNFNWTLNSDLSYDITLYLISWGDIIDSLKINTNNDSSGTTSLLVGQPNDDKLKIPENLLNIENNKSLSTLNSFFYDLYKTLSEETLSSLSEETQKVLEEIKNQNKLQPITQSQINDSVNFLNELLNKINQYSGAQSSSGTFSTIITKEEDQKSIDNMKLAVQSILNEINSISTSPQWDEFTKNSGDDSLIDFLKNKIDDAYNSPVSLSKTSFEIYLKNLPSPYNINV